MRYIKTKNISAPRNWLTIDVFLLGMLFLHANAIWLWPADSQSELLIEKPLGSVLMLMVILTCAIAILRFDKSFLVLFQENFVAAVFFCMIVASVFWSIQRSATLVNVSLFMAILIFTLQFARIYGQQFLLDAVFRFASVVLLASFALSALQIDFALMKGIHSGLWRGLFSHKNLFGSFSSLYFLMVVFAARGLGYRLATRVFWGTMSLIALLMTGSSTAIGIAAGTTALVVGISFTRRLTVNISIFAVVSVYALIFGFFVVENYLDYALEILGRDTTFSGRDKIWAFFLTIISNNGWLGTGYATPYMPAEYASGAQELLFSTIRSPHNAFMGLALNLGWMGALLYATWLSINLIKAIYIVNANPYGKLYLAFSLSSLFLAMVECVGWADPTRGDFFFLYISGLVAIHSKSAASKPTSTAPHRLREHAA